METTNSPSLHTPATKRTALRHLKALSLQIFRKTKGFFDAQKLPFIASKVCDVYLGETNKAHHTKCRHVLQMRLELNPLQLQRFFHTSLGHTLITWFERFFRLSGNAPVPPSLKELLVEMATDPEGLSLLSFIRRSPAQIQLNLDQVLLTAKQIETLLHTSDAIADWIRELSELEAAAQPLDATPIPAIDQPGPFAVQEFEWQVEPAALPTAHTLARPLQATCYQPDPLPEGKIPVVVQSHGLASSPEDLAAYAQYLASYGYLVVAPHHAGSNSDYVRDMLAGTTTEVFEQRDFLDRPQEVSRLLDALEDQNAAKFDGRLHLKAVGVMGYSFGAYTALALAGGEIQFGTLEQRCDLATCHPNLSLLLQCQALRLPRSPYPLRDDRVQAVLALDSLGSAMFGAEGIGNIHIPVLLIAGSHDIATPLALEQIRIFQWLTTAERYLALIKGKVHIRNVQRLLHRINLHLKLSPHRPMTTPHSPCDDYTQALSLAFFNQHLAIAPASTPPLSARYGAAISQAPYQVWVISQASSPLLHTRLQTLDLA